MRMTCSSFVAMIGLVGALLMIGCYDNSGQAAGAPQASGEPAEQPESASPPDSEEAETSGDEDQSSGPVMFSTNFRQIARGTTLAIDKIDGIEKHVLVVPPGKLEEPFSIVGAEQKEERIVLNSDEETKAFIRQAESEPSDTTFAVIVELTGSSGSYTGSVVEFQKEEKEE